MRGFFRNILNAILGALIYGAIWISKIKLPRKRRK